MKENIPTGLYIELPIGYEAQIRPRSGLCIKSGITVLNTPGTIDADYRGEVKVIIINMSNENFTIHNGDRIAQMIVSKHEQAEWEEVESLTDTEEAKVVLDIPEKNKNMKNKKHFFLSFVVFS